MNKWIVVGGIVGLGALAYALRGRAATPSPKCNEGAMVCRGYDLYVCKNGKWVLKEMLSPTCGYKPPSKCTKLWITANKYRVNPGEKVIFTVSCDGAFYKLSDKYDVYVDGRKVGSFNTPQFMLEFRAGMLHTVYVKLGTTKSNTLNIFVVSQPYQPY